MTLPDSSTKGKLFVVLMRDAKSNIEPNDVGSSTIAAGGAKTNNQ